MSSVALTLKKKKMTLLGALTSLLLVMLLTTPTTITIIRTISIQLSLGYSTTTASLQSAVSAFHVTYPTAFYFYLHGFCARQVKRDMTYAVDLNLLSVDLIARFLFPNSFFLGRRTLSYKEYFCCLIIILFRSLSPMLLLLVVVPQILSPSRSFLCIASCSERLPFSTSDCDA